MSESFIHLQGVRKVYRRGREEFLAISDASFDVMPGELVSLVAQRTMRCGSCDSSAKACSGGM